MERLREALDARRGGISLAVVGPAGTGKSSFLGSIGRAYSKGEVLLLAPKPREINSWRYREFGFDEGAEVFRDFRWQPSMGLYEADAFLRLERRVLELYDDKKFRVVVLDPYTDVVGMAAHDLLKSEKAATPKDSADSRGHYGSLKHKLENFTKTLVNLSSPGLAQPKHVLVAVHAQPAKDDEKSGGAGVSFEGEVMPMIEGGHRHSFGGEFDIVCYSRVKHTNERVGSPPKMVRRVEYLVQVGADARRHAKVALAARLEEAELENDVCELLRRVI